MTFILVDERAPRGGSTCAHCGKPIATGYLRDPSYRRPYCDHACFVGGSAKVTQKNFWLGGMPHTIAGRQVNLPWAPRGLPLDDGRGTGPFGKGY
jgi:hypothetical protein